MSTVEGEEVLTRDTSSGRIHRRVLLVDGRLIPFGGEPDNLDDAGAYSVLTTEEGALALEKAEPGELCLRCFPDVPEDATPRGVHS